MNKPVRMHSWECDKAGIKFNTGEIPGGCTSTVGVVGIICRQGFQIGLRKSL